MNNEAAKDAILSRIRQGKPQSLPRPEIPAYPFAADPLQSFLNGLIGFDGRAVKFRNREAALQWLQSRPEMDPQKHQIYSSLPEINGNINAEVGENLRKAADIHTCVTEGILGVGEMGSIWVTDASLVHTVSALLTRHLFILLDAKNILGSMHDAYANIKLGDQQYGSFISGPSATADIEAVHITGAQGALSLTALIYGIADAPEPPELLVNPNADSSVWQDL